MKTVGYIILGAITLVLIFLRVFGRSGCGIICQFLPKKTPSEEDKKRSTYSERLAKIRKKLEKNKKTEEEG